jgi:hypothetical protein
VLRDSLLRGLHPNPSARKGLHLSALREQGGFVGQASRRQADAPKGRRLYREGDRSEPEGRRRPDHERIYAIRIRLSGHDFPAPYVFLSS